MPNQFCRSIRRLGSNQQGFQLRYATSFVEGTNSQFRINFAQSFVTLGAYVHIVTVPRDGPGTGPPYSLRLHKTCFANVDLMEGYEYYRGTLAWRAVRFITPMSPPIAGALAPFMDITNVNSSLQTPSLVLAWSRDSKTSREAL